jgi:hypothetical protein
VTLRRVRLGPDNKPRGHLHSFAWGREITNPRQLEIIKAPGDAAHIVYVDAGDYEIAESWHPTVDAALCHAKWEYGVEPDQWEDLAPGARPV